MLTLCYRAACAKYSKKCLDSVPAFWYNAHTVRKGTDMTDMMTVYEVAEFLRIDIFTVYRRIKSGKIPAVRLDGCKKFLVPRAALMAALKPVAGECAKGEQKGDGE